jgi:CRISPR-associated protein Cas2
MARAMRGEMEGYLPYLPNRTRRSHAGHRHLRRLHRNRRRPKRLRRVAKACESMGQRVQKSVFECQVNEMQLEQLERTAGRDRRGEDNLRFYRITEPVEVRVKQFGAFRSVDFEGPLVI